jgi:hypothetical protein
MSTTSPVPLDSRVPRFVVAARDYRDRNGVALFAMNNGWRLVLVAGARIAFRPSPALAVARGILNGAICSRRPG